MSFKFTGYPVHGMQTVTLRAYPKITAAVFKNRPDPAGNKAFRIFFIMHIPGKCSGFFIKFIQTAFISRIVTKKRVPGSNPDGSLFILINYPYFVTAE